MSWSVGYDTTWKRDIGYGVPAICDRPACGEAIDRGLSYVCGGEPYGGEAGCGLYFCGDHMFSDEDGCPMCARCLAEEPPYEPTPDTAEWLNHKLTDESWERWRSENPAEVERIRALVADPVSAPATPSACGSCTCPCSCWGEGVPDDGTDVPAWCMACRMSIHSSDRPRPKPVAVADPPSTDPAGEADR
jgi:hypothetical protein